MAVCIYTVQCRSLAVCIYGTVQINGCVYIWYSADQWQCVYSIVQINCGVYIYGTV